ncbi:hypothetical protein DIURU_000716 [Diutina rugosa]|uniref:Uncharacterized protein n=1 Tax=Diutina rugosa TaxID=5481 RepID=A0A642V3A2_DIURU|nr:uncharacterized protein DIURU_000716 [Diutina rugosa]KAA8907032.1 hypothetical protein DIURU_000716 [Diutina rugosa]
MSHNGTATSAITTTISPCGHYVVALDDGNAKICAVNGGHVIKKYQLQHRGYPVWEPLGDNPECTKVAIVGQFTLTVLMVMDFEGIEAEPVMVSVAGLKLTNFKWISAQTDQQLAADVDDDAVFMGVYSGAVQFVVTTEFNLSAHLWSLTASQPLLSVENPLAVSTSTCNSWSILLSQGQWLSFANVGAASVALGNFHLTKEYSEPKWSQWNSSGTYWAVSNSSLSGTVVDIYTRTGDLLTWYAHTLGIDYQLKWITDKAIAGATVADHKVIVAVYSLLEGRIAEELLVQFSLERRIWCVHEHGGYIEMKRPMDSTRLLRVYGSDGIVVVVLDREVIIWEWVGTSLVERAVIRVDDVHSVSHRDASVFICANTSVIQFSMGVVSTLYQGSSRLRQMVVTPGNGPIVVVTGATTWEEILVPRPADYEVTDTFAGR